MTVQIVFFLAIITLTLSFDWVRPSIKRAPCISLSMKWAFGKGAGSLQDLGAVGAEGELYFHPSKPATLRTPNPTNKAVSVPIFPYNSVLVPRGLETIQVLEMQNRQLFYDVGDGYFGFVFLNPQAQKVALVGTIARIKNRKLLEDGRSVITVEGVSRFFLKEVVTDKPYIKARVQIFDDYTETTPDKLDELERKVLDEVRFNVKVSVCLSLTVGEVLNHLFL